VTSKEENLIQTAVRVSEAALECADRLAEAMSQPGLRLTRTDILRMAIYRGIDQLDTEHRRKK
jgi:hypothetical protein